jgi:hypothetical protein
VGVETVPEQEIRYHLVAFDAQGRERPEKSGLYSHALLQEAVTAQPTDVFLFSHGWNGDVPAARRQYGKWLTAMATCAEDRAAADALPGGFRPLLVGLHWPSKPWGDEELGPAAFGINAVEDSEGAAAITPDELIEQYAARLGDSPAVRAALSTIFGAVLEDAAPFTLSADVRLAYDVLNAEAGLAAAGEGAAPGDDRIGFNAEATYQACLQEELASFGGPSLGGVLAPLRVLSFWQMKRRARHFGESGAASLLDKLQSALPAARFHLMGHSFGCIVASAAATSDSGAPAARRPINSLLLVQGAMSLWSFCESIPARPDRPGYFHRLIARGLVDGPILVSTSVHDRAVRVFYPLGAGVRGQLDFQPGQLPAFGGIGTFGVRGPGLTIEDDELHDITDPYDFRSGVVYDLDGDDVIRVGTGAMGAHSDIAKPPVAHAFWQAVFTRPDAQV